MEAIFDPIVRMLTFFLWCPSLKGLLKMTMFLPLKAVGKQIKYNTWSNSVYTAKISKEFMSKVSVVAENYALKFNMSPKCVGPKGVSVDIVYYKTPPKNWTKKKLKEALSGDLRPTSKPDNDNVEKCIFDALNKIFYSDDAQIVENSTKKFYALEPSIEIDVKYL